MQEMETCKRYDYEQMIW